MGRRYDNPAKNRVRAEFFGTIDEHLPLIREGLGEESPCALYLPGEHNFEGPLYAQRQITAWGAEREPAALRRMGDPTFSAHPIERRLVHEGDISSYIQFHAREGRPRLSFANLDFEGTLEGNAREILDTFSVFPACTGGVLGVTTFCSHDPLGIEDGVLHFNALNNALGGAVMPHLDAAEMQWRHYDQTCADGRSTEQWQISRDMGLLWRLTLGMGLVEHPEEGAGEMIEKLQRSMRAPMLDMEARAARIRAVSPATTFYRVSSPELSAIFQRTHAWLFPLTLKRFVYGSPKSGGSHRMSTWMIFFQRLPAPQLWVDATDQLWQLYRSSNLIAVKPDGETIPIPPR